MSDTPKFQRMMKRLVGQIKPAGELAAAIVLTPEADGKIRITKQSNTSPDGFEFSMLVRVKQDGEKAEWVPIEFIGSDGEVIRCESVINGKTLVNMSKQASLNELAETWAKSLDAQIVVSTVDNALLR